MATVCGLARAVSKLNEKVCAKIDDWGPRPIEGGIVLATSSPFGCILRMCRPGNGRDRDIAVVGKQCTSLCQRICQRRRIAVGVYLGALSGSVERRDQVYLSEATVLHGLPFWHTVLWRCARPGSFRKRNAASVESA